jgi:SAM-dependent methyltransferase
MRTEGAGAARESIAIGLGMFIGCLPLYGLHLALCIGIGWMLGLNRLKMYVAANISNPFVAPLLLFCELQLGSLLRRGGVHGIGISALRTADLRGYGADLVIGSIGVGTLLGVTVGLLTFLSARQSGRDPAFVDLVSATADRYVTVSITAWEFARGKLRGDQLYRTVVCGGVLPGGERLLDLGCGSGLMLAILAEARARARTGTWASSLGPPAIYERLTGIDSRRRVVAVAGEALGDAAEVRVGDAREQTETASAYDAVLVCDVLHMMPFDDQERVLDALCRSLREHGVLIVREADAAGGWRFHAVRLGNRLKALAFGHWGQRFYFRTQAEWARLFAQRGLVLAALPNGQGTPFASVLFRLTAPTVAFATDRTPAHAR